MNKSGLPALAIGVFSILNTEMGVIGILPAISGQYGVDLMTAGLLVSMFALAIAIAGPILPMWFSRFEKKKIMVFVLGLFAACNVVAAFATSFPALLLARVLPAFFHPVYVSFALAIAPGFAEAEAEAPKAVSKVIVGVSAGMVLGAPIAGLIASAQGIQASFLFFAVVNLLALAATIFLIPELPEVQGVSLRKQLGILGKRKLWLALAGVMLLNGSIFGVYSYVSGYLGEVLGFSAQAISVVLFAYGLMNVVGNVIAGKGLSTKPNRFMGIQPVVIGGIYILILLTGASAIPTMIAVLLWGVAAGMVANVIQHWVATAAPEAPEFANGLYLTAANLGISAATPFCGLFIERMGMQLAPLGGIVLVACSAFCVLLKVLVVDRGLRLRRLPTMGK